MWTWVFLLLACFAGVTKQTQEPAPPQRVACPTCAGTGVAVQPCLRCNGSKTFACRSCSNHEVTLACVGQLEALAKLFPDDLTLGERAKVMRDVLVASQSLEQVLDLGSNVAGRPATVRCPICIMNLFRSADEVCRNCRGTARVDCPTCDAKGRRPCGECQRKGTQRRPCETCNGSKEIARPSAQPSEASCPWCGTAGWRACVQCEKDGTRATQCILCNGGKTVPCANCGGSKRGRCAKCMGVGRLGAVPLSKAKEDCKNCKATGRVPCEECRSSGKKSCNGCEGKGTRRSACENCHGVRKTLCVGCTGVSSWAWEITAEFLTSTGARDDALAHWRIAESRTEKRFAALLESALGEDARKGLEKARAAELARMRKRIEALKE